MLPSRASLMGCDSGKDAEEEADDEDEEEDGWDWEEPGRARKGDEESVWPLFGR